MFEKSIEILDFGSNVTHPKLTLLVHFGTQFTAGKANNIAKTKLSAKILFLGISNTKTSRSKKNDIILIKLSKKTFWGPKLVPGDNYQSSEILT